MDGQRNYRPDPWEESSWRTGFTRPPKSRSGCLVLILAAVIALGGIFSIFSLLRKEPEPDTNSDVGFTDESDDPTASTAEPLPTGSGDISLELSDTPQGVANIPQEGGLSLQEIYEKNIPSVVSVTCNTGTGTGVVIDAGGYLVTNHHVIKDASEIQVLLSDGRQLEARVVGSDMLCDLAVLRVDAADLTAAEFGDSDAVRVGDAVVAIGDPLGIELRGTMTDGIVSAINRDITTGGRTMTLLQTNAALNSGNSGGPLLNCYGQVIGINTMKIGDYVSNAGVEGLGFAIPSTTVKEVVDQLLRQGYVPGRPSLGIAGQMLSSFDQLYYRLPQGFYITQVNPGSTADLAGLEPGDIVVRFEGTPITDSDTLRAALYNCTAGQTVTLHIYRKGETLQLDLTLDEAK